MKGNEDSEKCTLDKYVKDALFLKLARPDNTDAEKKLNDCLLELLKEKENNRIPQYKIHSSKFKMKLQTSWVLCQNHGSCDSNGIRTHYHLARK